MNEEVVKQSRSDRDMLTGNLNHWGVLIMLYVDSKPRFKEAFDQMGIDPEITGRYVGVLLENLEPISDQFTFMTQALRRVYPQGVLPEEINRLGTHMRVASFLINKLELTNLME